MTKNDDAKRKRDEAIRTLRDCGMTDAEIEAELGHPVEDEEIIDAEIVSETTESGNGSQVDPRSLTPMLPANWAPKQWSEEWWARAPEEMQARRCKAKNTKGQRCQRISINGSTGICYTHGGAAPQVRAAAKARLDNAADRMARNLLGLAEHAESETVQLGATNSALDRAGIFKPAQVEVGPIKPYEEIFDGIVGGSRESARKQYGYDLSPVGDSDDGITTAPAFTDLGEEFPSATTGDSDCDPPASTQSGDSGGLVSSDRPKPPGNDNGRSVHIQGEDAIRMAAKMRAIESPHKRYRRP